MRFIPLKQPSPTPDLHAVSASASFTRRLLLLLASLALGLVVGFIGAHLTSQDTWFLAVPVCIAIGWLFVANPDECALRRNVLRGKTIPLDLIDWLI